MSYKLSRAGLHESPADQLDEPGWYVAYTQPRREQTAVSKLTHQGFKAYLPQFKTFNKPPAGLLPVFVPMFPRYVFFGPGSARQSNSGARSTRGVAFILSFGVNPALLKPEQLCVIQLCESQRNQARLEETSRLQPGLKVRLRHCGLQGMEALVQSVSAKRVTLLLELLDTQSAVHVEHHQLELAQQGGAAGEMLGAHQSQGGGMGRWSRCFQSKMLKTLR